MSSMPPPPPEMPPPPPPPPPGMPPGGPYGAPYGYVPPAGGTANLAEWWRRGLAVIIDWLVVVLVWWPIVRPRIDRPEVGAGARVNVGFGGLLVFFAVWTLYTGLLHGLKGQTLGKMAIGVKVVRRDTGALLGLGLGLARSAVHDLLWQVCILPGILDSLWPLWDKERQTLHDKAVGSVVVKTR